MAEFNGRPFKPTMEEAIRLHRQMWREIKDANGRSAWLSEHGYENILGNCFLCEYAQRVSGSDYPGDYCKYCPLNWGQPTRGDKVCLCESNENTLWYKAPTSVIANLPEW